MILKLYGSKSYLYCKYISLALRIIIVKIVQVIVGCVIDILTIETFKFKHFNMTTLSMKPTVKIY